MFNSIAFAIWVNEISTSLIIIASIIAFCPMLYYLYTAVSSNSDKPAKVAFSALFISFVIFLIIPQKSTINVLLDEAISSKMHTDLSEKSWAIINKVHSELNKEDK